MDMDFSPEDLAFRDEVRTFLAENLPDRIREGARRTAGVFVEPDIGLEWHRILYRQGWVAHHWPKEDGGTAQPPTGSASLEIAIDALDIDAIRPFWMAVLGYVEAAPDVEGDIVRQVEDQNISDRREGEGREFSQRAAATHSHRFVSELALQFRLPARPRLKHHNRPHGVGHGRLSRSGDGYRFGNSVATCCP